MLGIFTCLVLLVWGINDPDQYGILWYPFCILGEISIILFSKVFVCDASCVVSKLSYVAIFFHLVAMMAYCYDIDSIYSAYGTWISLIQTMQIWTLALYPITRRIKVWTLTR